ncbi:hypothetical protein SS50377_21825 [Spironucleus salmonicida]|uniref:Uncharacterized protein n=1 Tax=Spironucleus salmonicida TaxID=348837 RepID=A0A9P8LXS7_9EUKA|nr:hypothetical protein SS50377_21825 [Spironucleus salmonicida]
MFRQEDVQVFLRRNFPGLKLAHTTKPLLADLANLVAAAVLLRTVPSVRKRQRVEAGPADVQRAIDLVLPE